MRWHLSKNKAKINVLQLKQSSKTPFVPSTTTSRATLGQISLPMVFFLESNSRRAHLQVTNSALTHYGRVKMMFWIWDSQRLTSSPLVLIINLLLMMTLDFHLNCTGGRPMMLFLARSWVPVANSIVIFLAVTSTRMTEIATSSKRFKSFASRWTLST